MLPSHIQLSQLREQWLTHGWFVAERLVPEDDVAQARRELREMFPDMQSVSGESDPVHHAEQFRGLVDFPFRYPAINHVAAHERITELVSAIFDDDRIMLFQVRAWAKYTGAADYEQLLHRDFRSFTLTVVDPSRSEYSQMVGMLYLSDVTEDLGPTRLVSRRHTAQVPLHAEHLSKAEYQSVYAAEQSAVAPAGSLLAFSPDVMHRATNLVAPDGVRFTVMLGYQCTGHPWQGYKSWPKLGHNAEMVAFVESASPRQLELIGFPPPGDPFWTPTTTLGIRERYPNADFDAFFGTPR